MKFSGKNHRRRLHRSRLQVRSFAVDVEQLEDRTLLSAINITNADVPPSGIVTIDLAVVDSSVDGGIDVNIDGSAGLTALVFTSSSITNNGGTGININLQGVTLESLIFQSLIITNNQGAGVNVRLTDSTVEDFVLTDSLIADNVGAGFALTANNSQINTSLITRTTVTRNAGDGLSWTLDESLSPDLTIDDNAISDNQGNGVAIDLVDSPLKGLTITGNTQIDTNGASGVAISLTDSDLTEVTIDGNTIDGNLGGDGLLFAVTRSDITGALTNNSIGSNAGRGIAFDVNSTTTPVFIDLGDVGLGRTISGNQVIGNSGAGLFVGLSETDHFQGVFGDNSFNNNAFGVYVSANEKANVDLDFGNKSLPITANLFDGNADAGIGIDMTDYATGNLSLHEVTISNSVDGAHSNFSGEGLKVRLARQAELFTATIADDNTFAGNLSDGFGLWVIEQSRIADLQVRNSTFTGNANGLGIERQDTAVLNATFAGNAFDSNLVDGFHAFLTNRQDPSLFFDLSDNTFNTNGRDGIYWELEANIILEFVGNRNTISGNSRHGLHMIAGEDSAFGDPTNGIPSLFHNTMITNNVGDGVHLDANNDSRILVTFDSPDDAMFSGRTTISDNGVDAVGIDASSAAGVIFTLLGSDLQRNGDDGLQVATHNGAFAILNIGGIGVNEGNLIGGLDEPTDGNGGDGIDIVTDGGTVNSFGSWVNATIQSNHIRSNGGDGLSLVHHDNSFFEGVIDGNTLRFNGERGIDVLLTDYVGFRANDDGTEVGGLLFTINDNILSDNAQEGLLFVTDSGINQQFQVRLANAGATSPTSPFGVTNNLLPPYDPTTVEFFGTHRAVSTNRQRYDGVNFPWCNMYTDIVTQLVATGNTIRDNGRGIDSHGMFINVGTNSYVAADVRNNTFGGNVLSDFRTESFVSAGEPNNYVNNSGVNAYDYVTLDDTAQLDLRFSGNEGDRIQPFANGSTGIGARYTNDDPAKQNGNNGTNGINGNATGPAYTRAYWATNRRADIFQIDNGPGLNSSNDFAQFGVQQDVRFGGDGFVSNGYQEVDFADADFPDFGFPSLTQFTIGGPVTVAEPDAGTTTVDFIVNLTDAHVNPVTVNYTTLSGTAQSGVDFVPVSGTLTFAPGEVAQTITVTINGDTLSEFDESLFIQFYSPNNAVLPVSIGEIIITDNDPLPSVSVADASAVVEGNSGTKMMAFTVSLSTVSGRLVTVDYSTADITANVGPDFVANSGTLVFQPGETSKTVYVEIVGELDFEMDETLHLLLDNPVGLNAGDMVGEGTILNDDGNPSIQIADVSITEGGQAVVVLTLSGKSYLPITVDFATSDGDAVAGVDYTAKSGTVTFSPGTTSQTITFDTLSDLLDENDETFDVILSNATNSVIGDGTGVVTILDNDPLPSLTVADAGPLVEGDSGSQTMTFIVTLGQASGRTVTVNYSTVAGTASDADGDYQPVSGTLTFAAGTTQQSVTVQIDGDVRNEADETFTLHLANAVNATLADADGLGTIVNDDPLPALSIGDVTFDPEGNSGLGSTSLTVTLSAVSGQTVTVDYQSLNGSATAGADYTAVSGTLTFLPGETSKQIAIDIHGDLLNEIDETFQVNLSNVGNATLADGSATVTIVNDDPLPSLSVSDVAIMPIISENVNTAVFYVTLSEPSGRAVSVNFATRAGSAEDESGAGDFVSRLGTLTFAAGETSKAVTVTLSKITWDFYGDNFFLDLSLPTNATLADASGEAAVGGDTLYVIGGASNDQMGFTAGASQQVKLNGVTRMVDPATITHFMYDGKAGDDEISIVGTAIAENATLAPNSGQITGSNFDVQADDVYKITFDGKGGPDVATFTDSAGADVFVGSPTSSRMTGSGFYNQAKNVATYQATSSAGHDVAHLHDSAGDDIFTASPALAQFTGTGFSISATGFGEVYGYALNGGTDSADLFDSPSNDVFLSSSSVNRLAGTGYFVSVKDFETVSAHAINGGQDEAHLYDSNGNDQFASYGTTSRMIRPNSVSEASGFDYLFAYAANGGSDEAVFGDSSGDDVFVGTPSASRMVGPGFYNSAVGFATVLASATQGGNDVAHLHDSSGDDLFVASPTASRMAGQSFFISANSFEQVTGYSLNGGYDTAHLHDSAGDDMFVANAASSRMTGAGYYNLARYFSEVTGYSLNGGNDQAHMHDSAGDDTYVGTPYSSRYRGDTFFNTARNFAWVTAYALNGGSNVAHLYDTAGDDQFISSAYFSRVVGPGNSYFNGARNFTSVHAYSINGGTDIASLYGTSGDDIFIGSVDRGSLRGTNFNNTAVNFATLFAYGNGGGNDQAWFFDVRTNELVYGRSNYAALFRKMGQQRVIDFNHVTAEAGANSTPTEDVQNIDYTFETVGKWL